MPPKSHTSQSQVNATVAGGAFEELLLQADATLGGQTAAQLELNILGNMEALYARASIDGSGTTLQAMVKAIQGESGDGPELLAGVTANALGVSFFRGDGSLLSDAQRAQVKHCL